MPSLTTFPNWVPSAHPARAVLMQQDGQSSGSIIYRLLAPDEYSRNIAVWEALLGTRLIGIGEFGGGYELLFLASDGRCFSEDIVDGDVFHYHAESLTHFEQMTLSGTRSRPMLRPDQQSITSWGLRFTRDSPEVYDPASPQKHA